MAAARSVELSTTRGTKYDRPHPLPFEEWAVAHGYGTAPAVSPTGIRQYADRDTQAAFEMWNAGAASVARMVTESTLDTEALREKLLSLAKEP
jgi:hypothetical protein